MFAKGGIRPFFVGIGATLSRDIIFGGTYAFLRHDIYNRYCPVAVILDGPVVEEKTSVKQHTSNQKESEKDKSFATPSSSDVVTPLLTSNQERKIRFITNLLAACLATIISSPLNYVRNIHYATSPDTVPASMQNTLRLLVLETSKKGTLRDKVAYMLVRLTIGWGTARVALGMAFGSEFYYYCTQPYHRS